MSIILFLSYTPSTIRTNFNCSFFRNETVETVSVYRAPVLRGTVKNEDKHFERFPTQNLQYSLTIQGPNTYLLPVSSLVRDRHIIGSVDIDCKIRVCPRIPCKGVRLKCTSES